MNAGLRANPAKLRDLFLVLARVGVFAAAAPVLATNDHIVLESGYALAGEPFRVVVSGGLVSDLPYVQEYPAVQPDVLDLYGDVFIPLRGYELPAGHPYLFTVEAAPRPVGSYHLRSVFWSAVSTTQNRELATGMFEVFPAVTFDFHPAPTIRAGEVLAIELGTLRGCPAFLEPSQVLERHGDTFRVAVVAPGCDFPGPATLYTRHATFPDDLEPGTYHLDIVTVGAEHILARRDIIVLATTRWRVGPGGRFEIEVTRRDGQGQLGSAQPIFLPDLPMGIWESSLLFSFFSTENWELMLKVLDGCAINGHFWVFGAAASDVEYEIKIRDLERNTERVYRHEAGSPAPAITDTGAFACH